MLWVLPLEKLVERYTIQWWNWFHRELSNRRVEYRWVEGQELSTGIQHGQFLDAFGTNHWKMIQIAQVCREFEAGNVKDGDSFFTMDLWHPGIEAIPYMAEMAGIKVKLYGFLHAGSYTDHDAVAPMWKWAKYLEIAWAQMCEKIFVASDYHKRDFLCVRNPCPPEKIVVTGNPLNVQEIWKLGTRRGWQANDLREKIIIFPHRWDRDKNPNRFVALMTKLWRQRQDFRIVTTAGGKNGLDYRGDYDPSFPWEAKPGLLKSEYYAELAKAKVFVSTSDAEYFGYSLHEAMVLGCAPVVPNTLCYPEMVPGEFRYDSDEQALRLISEYLDNPPRYPLLTLAERFNGSVGRILDEIGAVGVYPRELLGNSPTLA